MPVYYVLGNVTRPVPVALRSPENRGLLLAVGSEIGELTVLPV